MRYYGTKERIFGSDDKIESVVMTVCGEGDMLNEIGAVEGDSVELQTHLVLTKTQIGQIYCCSKTMKAEDMQRLERTERMMVRWMCGASLKSRISSNDLNKSLNVAALYRYCETGWIEVVWTLGA